jgi:hypothetical protein
MAGGTVSSVLERTLKRLEGAEFIRESWELIDDHTHTGYLVLRLKDGTQAYVSFKRHGCPAEFARVVFEDGEVLEFRGEDADRLEEGLWEVIG